MDFGAARVIMAEAFGAQWNEHDVELDDAIEFISEGTEWSLLVCAPQAQRLHTQWGENS